MADELTGSKVVQGFLKLQEQRAMLYSQLHEGFKLYLSSQQERSYARLMTRLTQGFTAVSKDIIELEGILRDLNQPHLADLIRTIQNAEREKLQITMSIQALRKAFAQKSFSWQNEDYDPLDHAGHHTECSCCGSHPPSAPEPTEAEYRAALKEAMQQNERIIDDINTALEELRDELQD